MKTLVLCVDRDNDLGEKARVRSPVIGRAKNIEAATQLAVVDPEDSDVNAIFASVKVYDELNSAGHNVEIATICGGKEVNEITDMVLANQLELTLQFTGANGVTLITDGAEDEHILPLIQSRAKINSIKRVIVRQDHNIEGAYYFITKALEDEKMRKITLPLAMVLVVLGLSYFTDNVNLGWAFVITLLGVYLFVKGLHWEKNILTLYDDAVAGVKNFKVSLITSIVAFLLAIAGIVTAFDSIVNSDADIAAMVLIFVENAIWWLIGAGMVLVIGNLMDEWQNEQKPAWEYLTYLIYFIAVGLIITASVDAIQQFRGDSKTNLTAIFALLVGGVAVFVVWGRVFKNFINSSDQEAAVGREIRGWRK